MRTLMVVAVAAVLLVAVNPATAQVVTSKHDLSSTGPGAQTNVARVCVFCHTPHQAAAANAQDPLWNHTLSVGQTYTVYDSATFDANQATPSLDIVAGDVGSAGVSNLCLSCHDGQVAVHSLYNDPNEVASVTITAGGNVSGAGIMLGNPLLGTILADDHPVNITYDATLESVDGELNPANSAAVSALLFSSTVQCASCHDPHNTTNPGGPFMVMDNTASALCTTCHIK